MSDLDPLSGSEEKDIKSCELKRTKVHLANTADTTAGHAQRCHGNASRSSASNAGIKKGDDLGD